jgi:thiamine pyrophosphate-dependent acetolactate synthase large subunit-like protein
MTAAETLVSAEYPLIVAGDSLANNYRPTDAIELAETITADIVTVGDVREIFPDGEDTNGYLGPIDDNLDAVHAADVVFIVGVDIKSAAKVPWSVFNGEGWVMTSRSLAVYQSAGEDIPFTSWIADADADRLQELTSTVTTLASRTEPATIYSEQQGYPDPPEVINSDSHLPSNVKRWSSAEVKRCKICHTLTNQKVAIARGLPGPKNVYQCPAVGHRNHQWLASLLKQKQSLNDRREHYDETTETGQQSLARLENEQRRLTDQIESLRDWFDGRFDDVVSSDPDFSNVREVEPRE